MTTEANHVYRAISAITAIMAREGISKSRSNQQQGYRFRGIDDVYCALSGHLAELNLCMLPRVLDRTVTERPTKSGGVSTYVVLTVEFDLVSSVDGSKHTIRTMGEAMDTADKATNKAMSAAMKYACLMAFQIPTEGDNDADAQTLETAHRDLTGPLAASVAEGWVKWEAAQAVSLKDATTMGELAEAWTSVTETGNKVQAPAASMKKLAAIKDARKVALRPANGTATA
jgi:hypothetical protein